MIFYYAKVSLFDISRRLYSPKCSVYHGTLSDPFFVKSWCSPRQPARQLEIRGGFDRENHLGFSCAFGGVSIGCVDSRRNLTCALYCLLGGITRVIWRETNAWVEGYWSRRRRSRNSVYFPRPVFRLIKVRKAVLSSRLLACRKHGRLLFVIPFIVVANVAKECC